MLWSGTSSAPRSRGPGGGFDAELLCVLGVESLPAAELQRSCADDPSDGVTGEEPLQDVEADVPAGSAHGDESTVDAVPEGEPGPAAGPRFQFPAEVL